MCSSDDFLAKPKTSCPRMPWMMRLGDQFIPDQQLGAAYQATRIDHDMHLNVNCATRPARLTGIMVTLGAINSHPMGITDIVLAGANMVRMNMSHKDEKYHAATVQSIREAGNKIHSNSCEILPFGVAMDLRGPEIRTGIFNGDENSVGSACLKDGSSVRLTTNESMKRSGNSTCFWVSCPDLSRISQVGDKILIDRGEIILEVTGIAECHVTCKVLKGGTVKNEKIVHLVDTALDLPQMSEKDATDIGLALDFECDFLIISHTRNRRMVCAVKDRIKEIGCRPVCVLAKISSQQGLEYFDEILKAADGIVVDRAGIEVDIRTEKVFIAQKSIIAKCNRVGKPVIVAFHVSNAAQSRMCLNQISDAVLDGADSVLLKTGSFNVRETVDLIKSADLACREAESARWQRQNFEELSYKALIPLDPTHSIAVAAVETSMKCNAAAVIVTTTTGRTAMMLSTYRPRCPVVAITRYGIVARWLQIYFGIHPIHYRNPPFPDWSKDMDARIQCGIDHLRRRNFLNTGDAVVIVSGWRRGVGFTNCIRVVYASPGSIANRGEDFEESW